MSAESQSHAARLVALDPLLSDTWEVQADGCWRWRLKIAQDGYGVVRRRPRQYRAHRYVFSLLFGIEDPAMTVDHLCFNPQCVNPDHLRLLSRGANAGRRRHVLNNTCRRGLHVLAGDNLYRDPTDGRPRCRACRAVANRRRAQRNRDREAA